MQNLILPTKQDFFPQKKHPGQLQDFILVQLHEKKSAKFQPFWPKNPRPTFFYSKDWAPSFLKSDDTLISHEKWKNSKEPFGTNEQTYGGFSKKQTEFNPLMPAGNKKVINTFNACHQVPFQKHPINRFAEKFRSVDFGPKNGLFFPF